MSQVIISSVQHKHTRQEIAIFLQACIYILNIKTLQSKLDCALCANSVCAKTINRSRNQAAKETNGMECLNRILTKRLDSISRRGCFCVL